ncbi:MAG: insulinase family protein, partial [Candidatus Brocadiia bacterium]
FLEHMLFKGTDKLSSLEVNNAFDRTGAQFNAFTSEENTVYYAAVLPEYLGEVTDLWTQLMRPSLRNDDFNIEKNVIKEEIAMYQDMPSFDVVDRCRTLHFGEHSCGHSVLGSVESIDALRAEQMREYFSTRYAPNNMIVAAAGDIDWDQICSIIKVNCGGWEAKKVERTYGDFGGTGKRDRIEKANLSLEHVCLMSHCPSAQDRLRFAGALLSTIVGDDTGSRFFWELVDKAIAETAVMQAGSMDGTGVFYSYIRCSSGNAEQVLAIVNKIFADISQNGVTQDELRKAKNKILRALVIKNEIPMGRLIDLGSNWLYLGRYRKISEDVEAIKSVTVEDVFSLIEQYRPADFTHFSIGPATQEQRLTY